MDVSGKPLEPERRYTLATKAYIADGHDGYDGLVGGKVIVDEENARLLPCMVGTIFIWWLTLFIAATNF